MVVSVINKRSLRFLLYRLLSNATYPWRQVDVARVFKYKSPKLFGFCNIEILKSSLVFPNVHNMSEFPPNNYFKSSCFKTQSLSRDKNSVRGGKSWRRILVFLALTRNPTRKYVSRVYCLRSCSLVSFWHFFLYFHYIDRAVECFILLYCLSDFWI